MIFEKKNQEGNLEKQNKEKNPKQIKKSKKNTKTKKVMYLNQKIPKRDFVN